MSTSECAYHPGVQSTFTCSRCGSFACASCGPDKAGLCIKCVERTQSPLKLDINATLKRCFTLPRASQDRKSVV